MPIVEEREKFEKNSIEDDVLEQIESLAQSIEQKFGDLESILNITEEISKDSEKLERSHMRDMDMLWMFKEFSDDKDCNEWLEAFSSNIIEIIPMPVALGFFVKLSTR